VRALPPLRSSSPHVRVGYVAWRRSQHRYAWTTINFLLGKLGGAGGADGASTTVGTIDLGGGSTQIVFEPLWSSLTGARSCTRTHS
jgi:hypothetical protein